jgi:ribose 5-phosphate isomerase B
MKIAIGSDERTHVTDVVMDALRRRGHELLPAGPLVDPDLRGLPGPLRSEADNYWPAVARDVAEAVATGAADEGILFCWTGTGVSMAANKVPGIRAALCDDAETARGARLWNNANVLCLSLRRASEAVAKEILDIWFDTSFIPNDTDNACLAQLDKLEQEHMR